MSKHTPGPWRISRHALAHVTAANERGICSTGGYYHSDADPELLNQENEANARLIASAPDHALVAAAFSKGVAQASAFGGMALVRGPKGLERYEYQLDEFGCPVLSDRMRDALREAMEGRS